MKRVVITGLGAITPIGNSAKETWSNVKEGKCGIGPITQYDTTDKKVKLAAEVKDFDPADYINPREAKRMDRYTQFAMVAAKEAVEDSGLDVSEGTSLDLDRCGVIFSSGIGGIGTISKEDIKGYLKTYDRVSPLFIPMIIPNMAAGQIAIAYNFHGMCYAPVSACASSNNAIGEAFHRIKYGYEDVIIAGGAEATITELGVGGFTSLKALNTTDDPTRASIPFDKERGGFVMGEGGGALILEEYEHAKARGAKIYAEVVGYGASCDAHHITAPLEDGSQGARCMTLAVEDAGISTDDIDYINAHGTSTHLNDSGETKAVKLAFGDHAKDMMISSTKSMTGHLLGGAGAVEGIILALSLNEGFVPATIGYKVPDEECDLDIVPNEGRKVDIKYGLSNALGFGGHNAAVIFKKYED
ncbi:MAG: beta-ketoacyl-ACP synthase II [Lachnospiraceae bacterium]|nr:beta-ketoacyl-ACP synthase II [Lachnospiraceae bacterium]